MSINIWFYFSYGLPWLAQTVKNLSVMQETRVQSLGWEDPLKKRMVTHSSILSWEIPWTEELLGYSPWSRKESDMMEWLTFSLSDLGSGTVKRCPGDFNMQQIWEPLFWKYHPCSQVVYCPMCWLNESGSTCQVGLVTPKLKSSKYQKNLSYSKKSQIHASPFTTFGSISIRRRYSLYYNSLVLNCIENHLNHWATPYTNKIWSCWGWDLGISIS